MIKAHFKWKNLIIDIRWMNSKYKENWKKIKFSLFYGGEATMSDWLEDYFLEVEKKIVYEWQDEVILEVPEIKDWYRGSSIFIWYYIEVNFWRKFLLFKDSKEIEIEGREEEVFHKKKLAKTWKYNYKKEHYSYKKIFEVMPFYKKIILSLAIIGLLVWIYWFIAWKSFALLTTMISIWVWIILIITAWRTYFKWKVFYEKVWETNRLSEIINWKFSSDLEKLKIQVFATNSEKWRYEVDNGSTTSIVSFNTTVWSVLLFEKEYENIVSWTKIEDLLENEKIDINDIYKNLFPEIKITDSNWLALNLEVRIISKNFKDFTFHKEIHLDNSKFERKVITKTKNNKTENSDNNFNSDFFE